jgi:hypothetical protein
MEILLNSRNYGLVVRTCVGNPFLCSPATDGRHHFFIGQIIKSVFMTNHAMRDMMWLAINIDHLFRFNSMTVGTIEVIDIFGVPIYVTRVIVRNVK